MVSISNILKQNETYGACWPLAVHLHGTKDWVSSCRQEYRGDQAVPRCAPEVARAQLSCTGCTAAVKPGHGVHATSSPMQCVQLDEF